MPLLRGPDGAIIDVADDQVGHFTIGGYTPVTEGEAGAVTGAMLRPDSGALGGLGAFASSSLSGATLGLSDLALKGLLDRGDYERMATDRENHPILSGAGMLAGTILPTIAAPGSFAARLPAGAVGHTAAEAVAGARALGGAKGTIAALGISGVEGSLYNAGAYLSDTALGDRDLSAEGLAGALGSGFEFGAAGSVAAMGIEQGSIAARRMFSRIADGGERAAQQAEQAWIEKYQSTIDANDAAADIARAKLAEASLARQNAGLARDRIGIAQTEARAAAARVPPPEVAREQQIVGAAQAPPPANAMSPEEAVRVFGGDGLEFANATPGPGMDELRAAMSGTGQAREQILSEAAEREITEALAAHDTARAELEAMLHRLDSPEVGVIGGSLGKLDVPVGEFGAPGSRGYTPGEVQAPRPPAAVEPGNATAIGRRKLAEGTPVGERTTSFNLEDSGLRFNPENRTYHYPTPEAAEQALADSAEAIREGKRSVGLAQRAEPTVTPRDAGGDFEIARVGRPSEGKLEIRNPDGSTTPSSASEIHDWLDSKLPDGFSSGALESHRDFAIRHGVPATSADLPHVAPGDTPNVLYIARPSELTGRPGGLWGNELKDANRDSVLKAWDKGTKLRPVDGYLAEDGRLWIEDGNHRIQAAARTDRPIALRLRSAEGYKPQAHAEDIAARVRADLPARAAAAPTSDLERLLAGTSEGVAAGKSLGELGAPSVAEYRAAKAARTAESADHFRAQAIAKRAGLRDAAAPWNEGIPPGRDGTFSGSPMAAHERSLADRTHPLSIQQLESAHEVAVERAAAALEPAERAAAEREVASIERQMTKVGARPGAVEDIAAVSEAATKYEQSSARLAEALGVDAPPAAQEAAKAVRAAEEVVERKTMDRTTRAIDDHAERPSRVLPWEEWKRDKLPEYMKREGYSSLAMQAMGKDYQAYKAAALRRTPAGQAAGEALAGKLDAEAALARTRITETEARMASKSADKLAKDTRAAAEAARPVPATGKSLGAIGTMATAVGVAGELGVPGIPKPHDIPVIGPLLGVYLKYRAIKAAAGRFVGRVPATGDARAAALIARTKDRIATAVDRTLGLGAKPAARTAMVAAAAVLGRRAFDDGEPDAPKGASPQAQAAVRIREIAAAAARPELVAQMVRKQMRGVADPDLIAAAEKHMIARFQYLASVMPKMPPPNPFSKTEWQPSPAAADELAQRLTVAHDPEAVFTMTTPATVDTVKRVHPKLLEFAKQRLMDRLSDTTDPMTYQEQLRGSLLYGMPLNPSMVPESVAILQNAHAKMRPTPAPQSISPPTPSIAGPVGVNQLYDPGSQRRAARM